MCFISFCFVLFCFEERLLIDQSRFSLLYFAICGGCLLNKLHNYKFQNSILTILTLPIFSLWCCIEIVRIGLGYIGNLLEKVPMISAFLLLTIFPQLVAILFLTFLQDPVFPFDTAAGSMMMLFLLSELYVGRLTFRTLIERQTAQFFRLCQEEEMERILNTTFVNHPSDGRS